MEKFRYHISQKSIGFDISFDDCCDHVLGGLITSLINIVDQSAGGFIFGGAGVGIVLF